MDAKLSPSQQTPSPGEKPRHPPVRMRRWFLIVGAALALLVGAIWGALVFPVIASFYWEKVTNKAFTVSVLAALAFFFPVRFGWIPMDGAVGYVFDVIAVVGVGVVAGLMTFGFFGARVARIVGVIAALAVAPFAIGFLHDYAVLSGSLIAYAVSTVVCTAMSLSNRGGFDFSRIARMTGDFDVEEDAASAPAPAPARTATPADQPLPQSR